AYLPLTPASAEHQWILKSSWGMGYGAGLGTSQRLPFFAYYHAGGLGMEHAVRGYEAAALGPRDSRNKVLGGSFAVSGSLALIFPKPLSAERFRTSLFVDAGNVYASPRGFPKRLFKSGDPLRLSTGVALDYLIPGMNVTLNLSLAKALNPGS